MTPDTSDVSKAERETMEKPSLVYVRKVSTSPTDRQAASEVAPELSLGLATGTRLRARLESAASTAVRAPVLAVIEYNYEQAGEIIVPAGAKAVGFGLASFIERLKRPCGSGFLQCAVAASSGRVDRTNMCPVRPTPPIAIPARLAASLSSG